MSSHKRSARAKRVAEFKSQLTDSLGYDMWDEAEERERIMESRNSVKLSKKMCTSKNRYATEGEALEVARECAEHGSPALRVYECPLCGGWHLTSKKA